MTAVQPYNPKPFVQKLKASASDFISSGNKFFRALGSYSGAYDPKLNKLTFDALGSKSIRVLLKKRRKELAQLAVPSMNAFVKARKNLIQLMVDEAMKNQIPRKLQTYNQRQKRFAELKTKMMIWKAGTGSSLTLHPQYSTYNSRLARINDSIEDALKRLTLLIKKNMPKASALALYKLCKDMQPLHSIMNQINCDSQETKNYGAIGGGEGKNGVVYIAQKWFDTVQAKRKEFQNLFAAFAINLPEKFISKQEFLGRFDQSKNYVFNLIQKQFDEPGKFQEIVAKQRDLGRLTVKQVQDLLNVLNKIGENFKRLISLTEQAKVNDKEVLVLLNLLIKELEEVEPYIQHVRTYSEMKTNDNQGSKILDGLNPFFRSIIYSIKHNCKKYIPGTKIRKKTVSDALLSQITTYQKRLLDVEAVLSSLEASITAHEDRQKAKAENAKKTPW